MLAYQLRAKFDAGLVLCGQNFDKELEFIGSRQQWEESEDIATKFEQSGVYKPSLPAL